MTDKDAATLTEAPALRKALERAKATLQEMTAEQDRTRLGELTAEAMRHVEGGLAVPIAPGAIETFAAHATAAADALHGGLRNLADEMVPTGAKVIAAMGERTASALERAAKSVREAIARTSADGPESGS